MVSWIGFRQEPFPYERQPRRAGTSKYPLGKMIRRSGLNELRGEVPATAGTHDLCLTFAQKAPPVQWALKDIRLSPKY